jgi:thiol:disulfide interchange protein DsbD
MLRLFAVLLMLFVLPASGAGPEDLLEPDQAFRFAARPLGSDAIEIQYQIAPGYYLYRDKFRFVVEPAGLELGTPELPPGKLKKDEFFGEVQTYRGDIRIRVPVRNMPDGGTATLIATSQGCADAGVCYVPHEQKTKVSFGGGIASDYDASARGNLPAGLFAGSAAPAEDDGIIARLFHGEPAVLIASFFGFGLLLAFTPCVLPMFPILSGIIAGRGARLTRMHGFLLALAYVLGMAITYAIAGVLAGLSGAMLSVALQNAWVLGTFAAIFVLLAGAMFGLYELQLPSAMQTRVAAVTNRLRGGHLAGVFAMGALSALIVGPCVAAPLAGALLYISQSRDVVLGGSALFAMALGMGLPLLVVGASAGVLLPKAGPWMETVKRFFGVVLLGVAIYLVSPLLPTAAEMLAWAVLLCITGIYLRAIDPLPVTARPFDRFAKGVGVLALIGGIAFLVGALAGSRNLLQPLAGLRSSASAPASTLTAFTRIGSPAELDRAVASAAGRPVMLDFYADWCVSCKEMERDTFADPKVRQRLSEVVKLQADVTANAPEHQALLQRFRLFGPPGIIFFDPSQPNQRSRGVQVVVVRSSSRALASPSTMRLREWALIAVVAAAAGGAGFAYHLGRIAPEPVIASSDAIAALMTAQLPDLDNKIQAIEQWRGNVVVVNFWATWCAPCRDEIPVFMRLQQKYRDRGLQFVGIAIDQPDKVRPYAAELGMNFPILIGGAEAIELARKLGNRAGVLPYTVVVDRQGRVAATKIGAAQESKLGPLLASLL